MSSNDKVREALELLADRMDTDWREEDRMDTAWREEAGLQRGLTNWARELRAVLTTYRKSTKEPA